MLFHLVVRLLQRLVFLCHCARQVASARRETKICLTATVGGEKGREGKGGSGKGRKREENEKDREEREGREKG